MPYLCIIDIDSQNVLMRWQILQILLIVWRRLPCGILHFNVVIHGEKGSGLLGLFAGRTAKGGFEPALLAAKGELGQRAEGRHRQRRRKSHERVKKDNS